MRFQNPQFAPFLLTIFIPVLLHLRSTRVQRTITLPTFRFVQQSLAEQSKLRRVREKWLLTLRIGIVLALVGVFLKPVLTAPLARTNGAKRVVVAIVDSSLSMQATLGGISGYARAKGQCEKLLDSLDPQDRVNLIFAHTVPQPVLSRPSNDTLTLRQTLDKTSPTLERGEMAAAVRLAKEQLGTVRSGQKEMWLFSDFQRTNWVSVSADDFPKETRIVAVNTQSGQVGNSAVTELRLNPITPRANEPAEVIATLWNDSDLPRTFSVTLRCPELPLERAETSPPIAPHSFGTVTFALTLPQTRLYRLAAEIPADALNADNVRYLAADLRQSLTVILLSDTANNSKSAAYFVARALNPRPNTAGGVRVIVKNAATLSDTDLQTCDAVILVDLQTLPADRAAMLTRYVINGGNLIGFLTNEASVGQYTALNKALERGERLPFVPVQRLNVSDRAIGFSEARYRSPLLQLFRDASVADLGKAKFRRFFLTDNPDDKTEILIKYEDGTAAVARRVVGAGNVLLCNFSPSPADSDFAKMPEFPLLVHELLNGLTGENRERRDFAPGGTASATLAASKLKNGQVRATAPSGREATVTVDRAGGGVLIDRADEIGFYTVMIDGKEETVMAVNASADESDLRPTETRQWQSNQPKSAKFTTAQANETPDDLQQERPLWQFLILVAFALLLWEQAAVSSFSLPRRK